MLTTLLYTDGDPSACYRRSCSNQLVQCTICQQIKRHLSYLFYLVLLLAHCDDNNPIWTFASVIKFPYRNCCELLYPDILLDLQPRFAASHEHLPNSRMWFVYGLMSRDSLYYPCFLRNEISNLSGILSLQ